MGADNQQVSAPFRAGAPRTGWVGYPANQIEGWALTTQPEKVVAVGEAYREIAGTFRNSIDVLNEAAQTLAGAWKGKTAEAALARMRQMAVAADQISGATDSAGSALNAHGNNNLSYFKWYFGPGTWWAWKKAQVASAQANPATAAAGQKADAALQKEAQRQLTLHNGHIAETYSGIPAQTEITLPPKGISKEQRPSSPDSGAGVSHAVGNASGPKSGRVTATSGGHDHGRQPAPGANRGTRLAGVTPGEPTTGTLPQAGAGLNPPVPGNGLAPGGIGAAPGAGGLTLPFGPSGGPATDSGTGGRSGWAKATGTFGNEGDVRLSSPTVGSRAGQVAGEQAAESMAADEAATARAAQAGPMPMGTTAPGAGTEGERRARAYLSEETAIWGGDEPGVSGVIGAKSIADDGAWEELMPTMTTARPSDRGRSREIDAYEPEEPSIWDTDEEAAPQLIGERAAPLPTGDDSAFERRRVKEMDDLDGLVDLEALDALADL